MACTVAKVTFLESYLPEKHVANFFTIERNNLLINVCKMITDHILEQKTVTYWPHQEKKMLRKLGDLVIGQIASLDSLRPLLSWVNNMAKSMEQLLLCPG